MDDKGFQFYDSYEQSLSNSTPRIFVSSSPRDRGFCARLVQDLRTEAGDESAVWFSPQEGLRSGNMWWERIIGELNRSNIFIVVLSPDAMISPYVRYETNRAFDKNMPILPVLYRECVVRPDLQRLSTISFLHPERYQLAFDELLHTLGLCLKDRQTTFTVGKHIALDKLLSNSGLRLENKQAAFTTKAIQDMLQAIESAFAQERWYLVLRKISYLIEDEHSLIPASVYRKQAISLYKIGYKYLALESLDTALALVSNDREYLHFLKDYATIVVSMHRWIDLIKIVQEALQTNLNKICWLRIQEHLEQNSQSDTDLEQILTDILEAEEDISIDKFTPTEGTSQKRKPLLDKFGRRQETLMTQVDFAIITIRPDEFAAVLQRFPTQVEKGPSGRTYGISEVVNKTGKTCRVAVVRSSEQGNDAAQQVANDLINDLDPQILLVVGIAGGVPSDDFTLGDVIISTRIDNLNVSKRFEDGREEFDIRGGIHPGISDITASLLLYQKELASWNDPSAITLDRPEVDLRQFETDEFKAKIADGQKNTSWYNKVRATITSHFGSERNRTRPPLFETGTIASSNSLIRNIDLFVQWLQTARNILAVEMESAGVYQATQRIQYQYPVMAIRGISDIIGLERDNQWIKYACQTAAAFAKTFVTAGIITPRENTSSSVGPAIVSPQLSQRQVKAPQLQSEKQANGREPIEVFISYSAEDEKFKKQLETHLTMLRRERIIRPWHSQQIEPGQEWEQETANHIDSAQIILLLVSPSFLASDQLYENEMMRAMERQALGATRVIPIILRSADLGRTPFKKLLALPRNGKPVDTWRNADEIWSSIAQEIRYVCEQLHKSEDDY